MQPRLWHSLLWDLDLMVKGTFVEIQVTSKIARELGLKITGVTPARIANGQVVQVPTALAIAGMEGHRTVIEVLISESMPLAGISFLTKFSYKAIIDCKNQSVALERMI